MFSCLGGAAAVRWSDLLARTLRVQVLTLVHLVWRHTVTDKLATPTPYQQPIVVTPRF